jgi:hypothetical protein
LRVDGQKEKYGEGNDGWDAGEMSLLGCNWRGHE